MDKTNNLDIFMTDLADSIREATGETGSINAQSFSTRITGLGTGKQDKLVSGENIKTINGESLLGSGDIEISGGEDIRYFTEFTVNDFINACENERLITSSGLFDAIMNNKIICIPYVFGLSGGIIAASFYDYSDTTGLHSFICTLEYNQITYQAEYESEQIDGDCIYGFLPVSKAHRVIFCDDLHEISDNITYIVRNKVNELHVGFIGHTGSTIRFQAGDNLVIEFLETPLWPNGVMPEIEPNTYYELSLARDYDENLLAVLTPFKPV